MKALMTYEASDGRRFDSADKCQEYELIVARVAEAMKPLGPRPDLHHSKWAQHQRNSCLEAKRGLVAIARDVFKGRDIAVLKHDADEIHPCSILGRIIDDAGPQCLNRAWCRLMCINFENFREYDQPYFANHPQEAL